MPVLKNARHEKFAQALSKGKAQMTHRGPASLHNRFEAVTSPPWPSRDEDEGNQGQQRHNGELTGGFGLEAGHG